MPKLPRNMFRLKGGSYYFRQMINGRVVKRSLGQDYQLALARSRSLKDHGVPSHLTLEEAAQRWLESSVPLQRKDPSLPAQRVRDFLTPCLGHLLLSRLSGEECRGYRHWLERQGKSPQTVKHILSDLRCLLNWCEESGLIERSPFPRKILPKIQERRPDRLTEDELRAVCSIPDPHGFVCRLLVSTGLRWGEAVRAQGADVQGGVLVVAGTKTGKVRRVPLPREFLRVGRFVPFSSHGQFSRQVDRLPGKARSGRFSPSVA